MATLPRRSRAHTRSTVAAADIRGQLRTELARIARRTGGLGARLDAHRVLRAQHRVDHRSRGTAEVGRI